MEPAAPFTSTGAAHGTAASLRLRQGSSSRATWILDESPGGTLLTIGADAACDWQIRAPFVPARAFSVLLLGGTVYVRPGQELGVLLNGRPLESGYTPVGDGARIDVGLARFEVGLQFVATSGDGEASRTFDQVRELDSGTFPISERQAVPSVFEGHPPKDNKRLWRYALLGVVTASAYGGWVALLDLF